MRKGKILIIDDSVIVRNYLSKIISTVPSLEIVSAAPNGILGFQKILSSKPDVVILDLVMDNGDGLYVLQHIEDNISEAERPFVIIYSATARHNDPIFRKAIDFGFCDFILKVEGSIEELIPKLREAFLPKIFSGIEAKKTRELSHKTPIHNYDSPFTPKETQEIINTPSGLPALKQVLTKKNIYPKILIIGASTGGPQVIRDIVQALPTDINIPIVIVQHMPENFTKSFAEELASSSSFKVEELRHNMSLKPGNIYVFPGGMHGRVSFYGNLFVFYTDRKNYEAHPFKPSINLMLEHLISSLQGHAIIVILSGMGNDGTLGAKKFHDKGSLVIAQDKESSAVWGMPGSIVRKEIADIILSQTDLGKGLQLALQHYKR